MKRTNFFHINEANRKRSNKRGGKGIHDLLVVNSTGHVCDLFKMTQDCEDKLVCIETVLLLR